MKNIFRLLAFLILILAFWISGFAQNRISLDIKGMDIVDVLKTLATRAGLNIVVGKNVTGRVTLFLKDVDIQDAFELILLANDLAYEKKAEIINVMTQRDYELLYGERFQDKKQARLIQLKYAKAQDLARALNQIKTNLGRIVVDEASNTLALIDMPEKLKEMEDFIKQTDLPIATRIFNLNYAQADKLQAKVQEAITKGVGYIRIDERTNKIAVTDYPAKLDEISQIISAFDERTPQVLIDAQIIEIKPSDKFEMGVDWDFWIKSNFKVTSALPIGTSNRLLLGTAATAPSAKGDYKAIFDLLRTIGDTKILSSPRIMALNNQEARILVGTKDAYITSTTSQGASGSTVTSQSVNFVDTGIKLYVTPTINKEGFVTMKIKPEISSATRTSIKSEDKTTEIPIVSTSESETTVMVKDGITIIIGGLRKDKREKNVKKIPWVGDIPLLGFFFRSTSDESTKTELVILLTPHIMSGTASYTDFSELKPTEGAVARMVGGEIITEKVSQPHKKEEISGLSYGELINNRIKEYAKLNLPPDKKGEIELSFVLDEQGNLIGEPKILSSTDDSLGTFAINALKAASPFPAFAKEMKKEQEVFKVTLAYGK